jgi:hypothetical protein
MQEGRDGKLNHSVLLTHLQTSYVTGAKCVEIAQAVSDNNDEDALRGLLLTFEKILARQDGKISITQPFSL